MASVTGVIRKTKQPYGGYLPTKMFSKIILEDGKAPKEIENINPSLVGLAVDYLTRFMIEKSADKAFYISTLGAENMRMEDVAINLKSKITGLDDESIVSACKLTGFDVCYRVSTDNYKPIENINPDKDTIENIRIMVTRALDFFAKYGPVIKSTINFDGGGYTLTVNYGDADFVTEDTLWDFKVSKNDINSSNTLQILMYYIMGIHSTQEFFKNITQLGFLIPDKTL